MIEACSSCGYTVDPKCEVCKGTGEYDARAHIPMINAVRALNDDAVANRGVVPSRHVMEETLDAVRASEDHSFLQGALGLASTGKAIDIIGCALVAFKADVPRYRAPQVLLGKRKKEEGFDLWVLPGGKQEDEETPEACLRRETKEEIGVSRLISLQPASFSYNDETPDRKFLMLYFAAYIAGEEPRIVAHHEFSDLQWFDVDMLPTQMWQSDRDAIAQTLLMRPR